MNDYSQYKGTIDPKRLRARIDTAMNDVCDLRMDAREVAELLHAFEECDALAAHVEALKIAGENAALEASSVSQASIEWARVCDEAPTASLARHDDTKHAEKLEALLLITGDDPPETLRETLADEARRLREKSETTP